MIHYILQIVAFQLLFLLLYDLFLRKETFFTTNRVYLLVTSFLSLFLPLIDIPWVREQVPTAYHIQLPAVILGESTSGTAVQVSQGMETWTLVWILGALLAFGVLAYKYRKIWNYRKIGKVLSQGAIDLVVIPKSNTAFSFMDRIYIGSEISGQRREQILMHESVHVQERHSWDLIYFEVLKVVLWFNPLVYLNQKRMSVLHEFIADAKVAQNRSHAEYYQGLLSEVFQTEKIAFINTFFNHSLIKKRIIMLQRSRSRKIDQWKYLLLIPVVTGMLFYTSCSNESVAQESTAVDQTDAMQKISELKRALENDELSEDETKALKEMLNKTYSKDKSLHFGQNGGNLNFNEIDQLPVFPGCEGTSNDLMAKCFTQKITEFVVQNFNTKGYGDNIEGRQRIAVKFVIDKSGQVTDVLAKAQHQELMDEAVRVANLLPKMTPGVHQGKNVGVAYALPILFEFE